MNTRSTFTLLFSHIYEHKETKTDIFQKKNVRFASQSLALVSGTQRTRTNNEDDDKTPRTTAHVGTILYINVIQDLTAKSSPTFRDMTLMSANCKILFGYDEPPLPTSMMECTWRRPATRRSGNSFDPPTKSTNLHDERSKRRHGDVWITRKIRG